MNASSLRVKVEKAEGRGSEGVKAFSMELLNPISLNGRQISIRLVCTWEDLLAIREVATTILEGAESADVTAKAPGSVRKA